MGDVGRATRVHGSGVPTGSGIAMDGTAPRSDEQVFRLLYRSHDRIPPEHRKAELGSLFGVARSNNKQQRITGALLVADGHFVQVLEGEEAAVRALFARISADPRHDEVELVETTLLADRVFARWAMAEVGVDGADDVPLIAHTDGIAPAAGHRSTPEQSAVLSTMRAVAAGSPASH